MKIKNLLLLIGVSTLLVACDVSELASNFEGFQSKIFPESILPILVQLISTLIIFVVVAKFIFKPVREILRKRADYIANQINESQQARKNALEYEKIAKSSINEAQEKSKEILLTAEKQSQAYKEKTLTELDEEIKIRKERAENEIMQDKKKAEEEIRQQIIDVALQASEAVLNREVSSEDNARLLDDFVKDIVK